MNSITVHGHSQSAAHKSKVAKRVKQEAAPRVYDDFKEALADVESGRIYEIDVKTLPSRIREQIKKER